MSCPNFKKVRARVFSRSFVQLLLLAMTAISTLLVTGVSAAQKSENAIVSIDVQNQADATTVKLVTKDPVGYRYTVYDSFDPVRVVVDFPGMDVSEVKKVIPVKNGPVQEVKVSSFDLTSGKLGRVEMLLSSAAKYQVDLEGKDFQVKFDKGSGSSAPATATAVTPKKAEPQAVASAGASTKAVAAPVPSEKFSAAASRTAPAAAAVPAAQKNATAPAPDAKPQAVAKVEPKSAAVAAVPAPKAPQAAASDSASHWLEAVQVKPGEAVLRNTGEVGKYQYFTLGSPPRLVVDLYGKQPRFKERTFAASEGFKKVRIGTYADKTRLVFDASGKALPAFKVTPENNDLVVSWGKKTAPAATPAVAAAVEPAAATTEDTAQPVKIEAVDFDVKDGKSLVSVALSAPAKVIPATASGTTVGFGIKDATISRSLRRTLDASAFPSAVKRVTPYTVLVGNSQDVRFAVELKGMTDYSLQEEGKSVVLSIDNKGYENHAAPESEVVAVPVPETPAKPAAAQSTPSTEVQETPKATVASSTPTAVKEAAVATPAATAQPPSGVIGGTPAHKYTGQKITLVFDDADIRNILQLIAEVSNLNIIASDDVKGTITLRLVDVPWDQALALILDIKDLGMVRQGNVVRIMPREKLQAMEEARLNASRTREKLEDLETALITVNYADLGSIAKQVQGQLTQGRDGVSISEDARNKLLIIKDIPSNLAKIKALIKKLDTPERQVMIEARIVEATSSFSRDLGVHWGFSSEGEKRDSQLLNNQFSIGAGGSFLISPPDPGSILQATGMGAGISFGTVGSTTLDLVLSALEASGKGKVISTPRISTLNGGTAKISQGTKIPYQSSGPDGPKTEFVDANLELNVTPVINPDNSMILDIKATNSSVGSTVSTGSGSAPAIDTREATTKLLVRDGQTTVIGGIFVETESSNEAGVPWLQHIPLLGYLFKSTNKSNQRAELLIFITPRIIN